MNNDTRDTIIVVIIYITMLVGFQILRNWLLRLTVRQCYKRYNMGGFHHINKNAMTWKKASKVFGIRIRKLKKMSKDEIKKVYRMRAKKAHPDHGGNDEKFNTLNEAYQFAYAA